MLEARIDKVAVVQDQKTGGTVLVGYATYYDTKVNFKVPYDWDTLDIDWFVKALRDKLAQDFDLPVNRVDIREKQLLEKMKTYSEWAKNQSSVLAH